MAERYPLRAESPIAHIRLHPIAMPLVETLVTSFGSEARQDALRAAVLVELELVSGVTGWGECVASWGAALQL
jgi:L-alanine-DL-glutamate epimerase-like enolase superfamily enzyme